MDVDYATRRRAAVILLVLFSLSSNLIFSLKSLKSSHEQRVSDSVNAFEKRFEGIKQMLPRHAIIGYISDQAVLKDDLSWHDPGNEEAWRESRRVQYALSPLLLDVSPDHQIVVGNFRDQSSARERIASGDLILLREFDDGVLLLSNNVK